MRGAALAGGAAAGRPARRFGSAGVAVMKLIKKFAPKAVIIAVDSQGIVWNGRTDLNATKQILLSENIIEGGGG